MPRELITKPIFMFRLWTPNHRILFKVQTICVLYCTFSFKVRMHTMQGVHVCLLAELKIFS